MLTVMSDKGPAAELVAKRKHYKYKKIKENGYHSIDKSTEPCGQLVSGDENDINGIGRNMAMQTGAMKTMSQLAILKK